MEDHIPTDVCIGPSIDIFEEEERIRTQFNLTLPSGERVEAVIYGGL